MRKRGQPFGVRQQRFPDFQLVTHKFTSRQALVTATGTITAPVVGNSLVTPLSGSSDQPSRFEQMGEQYWRYAVTSSRLKLTYVPDAEETTGVNGPVELIIYPSVSDEGAAGTTIQQAREWKEQPYTRHKILNVRGANMANNSLTINASTRKIFGIAKSMVMDNEQFHGGSTIPSQPPTRWWYNILVAPYAASTTISGQLIVDMTIKAKWYMRRKVVS